MVTNDLRLGFPLKPISELRDNDEKVSILGGVQLLGIIPILWVFGHKIGVLVLIVCFFVHIKALASTSFSVERQ